MFARLLAVVAFALVAAAVARAEEAPAPVLADTVLERQMEVLRLREALEREVHNPMLPDPAQDQGWIELARAELAIAEQTIDHPQLLVVVDRNPKVQQLRVVLATPDLDWAVIGGSRVSTGQRGRFDHYVTPRGVFHLTNEILGYRAEGTLNENGIRGLGAKGMRVWDFGWHLAMKGWSEAAGKPDRTPIRLMLHATDPDKLEQRLGRPASQGCVRIQATMNRFLDRHGVIDANYERAAVNDIRFRALLLPGRTPSRYAGDMLVIVDSADRAAPTVSAHLAPNTSTH